MVPPDPHAGRDVIVEIRGAEGGEEANLFARDLYDMYRAYAARHGLKVDTLSLDGSDLGGRQRGHVLGAGRRRLAAVQVRGRAAPGAAGAGHREPGPHPHVVGDRARAAGGRRGRGRRSTTATSRSTCSAPADRAGRASTRPTRPCASPTCRPASSCRCRTSAASCRTAQRAMQVLRARLLEAAERERDAERSAERRSQVGGGGRGEKIRTYNFKENRLTDHRIGFTIYRLADVLAGDLDDVVAALAADERARQLADDDVTRIERRARRGGDGCVTWRGAAGRDDRRGSASGRRRGGCARWPAVPTASTTCSTSRPPQRMVAHLDAMLDRHAAGEPLAYVLGRWGFRHLDLARRPAGADPAAGDRGRRRRGHRARPRRAAARSPSPTSAPARAPSAWRSPTSCPSTACTVWLTDVSPDALDVARANLAGIGRRAANVRIADGIVVRRPARRTSCLDLVVANPPYVADGSPDVDAAVREWEPHARAVRRPRRARRHPPARRRRAPVGSDPAAGWCWRSAPTRARPSSACSRDGGLRATSTIRPDLAGRDRVAVGRVP